MEPVHRLVIRHQALTYQATHDPAFAAEAQVMDMLFYDGQCPLCRQEIATLQRLERGNLSFVDIHCQPDDGPLAPGREALLRRLHLVTAEGRWYTGLDATIRAWSHTPVGWLFRPLGWPLLRPVASAIYSLWADRRYRRRYQCAPCQQA